MGFQIAALAILAGFYGCYFAKMVGQRKKGIRTDQLGRGQTGLPRLVEPATKAATILVVPLELAAIWRGTAILPGCARVAGAALGTAGVGMFAASVTTMGDSWRAGVPAGEQTRLVTRGIYRYSRNPAFLAFDLVYLGIVLMFWSLPLFAASAAAALLLHLQIVNVEEDFLIAAFGEEYLAYCRQVNRYLGRKKG